MALFQITLGDYNVDLFVENCFLLKITIKTKICISATFFLFQYAELSHTTYPTLSKTVFTIFMILVPILLLNMLIAMMGNTYAHVIEQSEKEWMKQVINLEILKNMARKTSSYLLSHIPILVRKVVDLLIKKCFSFKE